MLYSASLQHVRIWSWPYPSACGQNQGSILVAGDARGREHLLALELNVKAPAQVATSALSIPRRPSCPTARASYYLHEGRDKITSIG